MNHKNLTFIMVIIWAALDTCRGFALQSDTTITTTTATTHWPPKVLKPQINWIQPAPSPFRKLSSVESLQQQTLKEAESPLRIDRKLFDHSTARSATSAAAERDATAMDLHNIDINPYAQSLNAELEIAFATVASYNNNNKEKTLPVAATNNLTVDQSPTGAPASTDVEAVPLDWHRYFTMDEISLPHQLPKHQQQQQQSDLKAAEVYQAKRLREMIFNKSL